MQSLWCALLCLSSRLLNEKFRAPMASKRDTNTPAPNSLAQGDKGVKTIERESALNSHEDKAHTSKADQQHQPAPGQYVNHDVLFSVISRFQRIHSAGGCGTAGGRGQRTARGV